MYWIFSSSEASRGIGRNVICQGLTLALFLSYQLELPLLLQSLEERGPFIEIMGMVAMSDHIAFLVLADDLVCVEAMIVLLFVLVTVSMFMLVLMVNWFVLGLEGRLGLISAGVVAP